MVREQNVSTIFAFQSFDGSPYPHYRLYPSNGLSAWATNRWGWLGTDTGVRKPPRTISVGMLGDSTMHNLHSLKLQTFLNAWGDRNGYGLRVEVFSIGRRPDDEVSALKYELARWDLITSIDTLRPASRTA